MRGVERNSMRLTTTTAWKSMPAVMSTQQMEEVAEEDDATVWHLDVSSNKAA